jgi:hypothetical protein
MGWLSHKRRSSVSDELKALKDRLDNGWSNGECVTLESVIKRASCSHNAYAYVYYSAVKKISDNVVFATIVLIDTRGGEIGYKSLDEGSGAYEYNCPKTILDRLTSPRNHYAYIWREICYGRLPRSIEYPSWDEGVETIDEAKAWIRAKLEAIKAEAKQKRLEALDSRIVVKDGDYVKLKEGAFVKLADNDGLCFLDYSRFRVVDKKRGYYKAISKNGVERKEITKLPPRKILGLISVAASTFEGLTDYDLPAPQTKRRTQPSLFDLKVA